MGDSRQQHLPEFAEQELFNRIWDMLQARHLCGKRGSLQYWRVYRAWRRSDRRGAIATFILTHAHESP